MIYLFEDNKLDVNSKMFISGYSNDISSNFVFLDGNGRFYATAERILKEGTRVCVFLDTSPGNKEIIKIYRRLRTLSIDNQCMLHIFPIVFSEYYYIKSIDNDKLIADKDLYNNVLNKFYFKTHSIYLDNPKRNSTFEKFCKSAVVNIFATCISSKKENPVYREIDCTCCSKSSLRYISKVEQYLRCWPIRPSGSLCYTRLIEDVYNIHLRLVNDFNNWQKSFSEMDTENPSYGIRIKPLPKLG